MKKIVQLVLAGIIGGCVAFGAFKMFDKNTIIYEQLPPQKFNTSNPSSTSVDFSTNFVEAADKANPAVVHISAQNKAYADYQKRDYYDPFEDFWGYRRNSERPQAGTGSGVLISENGYIVTNNHVVGFADFIEVITQDGRSFQAKKIGTDPSTDLAVLKIEGNTLPYLKFSNSDNVRVGEWVVAVGNPFNLTSTVTAGIVSAKGRELNIIKGQKAIEEFIQTDAVVNPGNSGGALVNTKGDLIGINTAISSPTGVYAGYSFAIPSNLVKRVVDEIMETGGDIQRAYLGINITNVSDAIASGIKIPVSNGVYVTGAVPNSSAQLAGVLEGDVITDVNESSVKNFEELQSALKFAKVGDTVNLTVFRNGKKKTIPVKLRRGI
jgi:Do/DeqQ family serine protease